jgi:hypothetical protein
LSGRAGNLLDRVGTENARFVDTCQRNHWVDAASSFDDPQNQFDRNKIPLGACHDQYYYNEFRR